MFEEYNIDRAQRILGEEVWNRILENGAEPKTERIYFEAQNAEYLISHAPTRNEQINIYLTRLPS